MLCTSADLALLPFPSLTPGYYLVGSGNTGVAGSLLILAALYTSVIGNSQWKSYVNPFHPRCLCPGNTSPTQELLNNRANLLHYLHSQSSTSFSRYVHPSVLATLLHCFPPRDWRHGSHVGCQPDDAGGLQPLTSPPGYPDCCLSLPHVILPLIHLKSLMWLSRSLAVANLSGRVVWASVTDRIGFQITIVVF